MIFEGDIFVQETLTHNIRNHSKKQMKSTGEALNLVENHINLRTICMLIFDVRDTNLQMLEDVVYIIQDKPHGLPGYVFLHYP